VRIGQTCRSLRDGPFGAGIVLGLHRAERADDLRSVAERGRQEVLIRETPAGNGIDGAATCR